MHKLQCKKLLRINRPPPVATVAWCLDCLPFLLPSHVHMNVFLGPQCLSAPRVACSSQYLPSVQHVAFEGFSECVHFIMCLLAVYTQYFNKFLHKHWRVACSARLLREDAAHAIVSKPRIYAQTQKTRKPRSPFYDPRRQSYAQLPWRP